MQYDLKYLRSGREAILPNNATVTDSVNIQASIVFELERTENILPFSIFK